MRYTAEPMQGKLEVKGTKRVYKLATVEFIYDKQKPWSLKKVNFCIDNNEYFIPLALTNVKSLASTWIFSKNMNNDVFIPRAERLNDKELMQVLAVAKDIVEQNISVQGAFKDFFEILPRQARLYRKYYALENPTSQERTEFLSDLQKSNIIIKKMNALSHNLYNGKNASSEKILAE